MFVAVFACVSLAATKHAVELTSGNFDELVNGNDRVPFLIKCYNPGCPHCSFFQKTWEPFVDKASQMQSLVKFGEINCNSESRLCRKLGLRFVPVLIWSSGAKPENYVDKRVASGVDGMVRLLGDLKASSFLFDSESAAVSGFRGVRAAYLMKYAKLSDQFVDEFFDMGKRRTDAKFALVKASEPSYELFFYGTKVASPKTFTEVANARLLPPLTNETLKSFGSYFVVLVLNEGDRLERYAHVAESLWRVNNAWARRNDTILSMFNEVVSAPSLIAVTPAGAKFYDFPLTSTAISKVIQDFPLVQFTNDPKTTSIRLVVFVVTAGFLVLILTFIIYIACHANPTDPVADQTLSLAESENVQVDVTSISIQDVQSDNSEPSEADL